MGENAFTGKGERSHRPKDWEGATPRAQAWLKTAATGAGIRRRKRVTTERAGRDGEWKERAEKAEGGET